jgi:predicted nucleic acid-binding protein
VRVALDTNVLAYAEGVNGASRKVNALELIQRLPVGSAMLPVQTLGELFQLLVRKANRTPAQARAAILGWRDAFPLIETSESAIVGTAELAATHRFSFWDGVVLAAAAEGGCRLLLTEDLQEGFTWNSVTVTNPFAASSNPLLTNFLL